MAIPEWLSWLGPLAGIATVVVGSLTVRAQARKMTNEGSAVILTAGAGMMQINNEQYVKLLGRLESLEAWQKRADRRMRRHIVWDNQVVPILHQAGIEIPPPPPLFDDDEDPQPGQGQKAG